MRAIMWCLHNDPKGADFITTGEKSCSVTVVMSDSSSIRRERTDKSAGSYTVTDSTGTVKNFAGFSNNIPVEVMNEHQMPKVTLAKDLNVYLNVSSQLDGPFLIKESPLNKASIVGRLIGTQAIDSAIKTVNAESLNYSKEIKAIDKSITGFTSDLKQFDDLQDTEVYMAVYSTMLDTYEAREGNVNKLNDLNTNLNKYKNQTEAMQSFVDELSDKDKLLPKIEEAIILGEKIYDAICFDNDLCNCRRYIEQETNRLETLPDDETALKRIANVEKLILETESLIKLEKERASVSLKIKTEEDKLPEFNSEVTEQFQQYIFNNIETCILLSNLFNDRNNVSKEILSETTWLKVLDDRDIKASDVIGAIEKETEQFLKATGTCMLCGSALTEDHIKHLIEGV